MSCLPSKLIYPLNKILKIRKLGYNSAPLSTQSHGLILSLSQPESTRQSSLSVTAVLPLRRRIGIFSFRVLGFFPVKISGKLTKTFIKAEEDSRHFQMSAGGAFGGNRGMSPVPPEKGIFPLDHMHECDLEKKDYVNCLKSSGHQSEKCRPFSKKYLECRMAKNLMAKQDMAELGFGRQTEMESSGEKNNGRIDT